jgi:fluoride exporter
VKTPRRRVDTAAEAVLPNSAVLQRPSAERNEPRDAAPAVTLVLVSIGGLLGALVRYAAGAGLPLTALQTTWGINVSGCFLMGVLLTCISRYRPRQRYLRPFLGVGVLGGYTTFSTFMVDLQTARPVTALAYLMLTFVGCLPAVWLGSRVVSGHR